MKLREQRLDEMFPSSQLLPGVDRLIRHLHSSGVPIAVATSSHRRHFDMKTTLHRELFSLFDHIVTGKPPPLPARAACKAQLLQQQHAWKIAHTHTHTHTHTTFSCESCSSPVYLHASAWPAG